MTLQKTAIISPILAHQIRTSEILPRERKPHLTLVILPRLSLEGDTLAVLKLLYIFSSSDVIVVLR